MKEIFEDLIKSPDCVAVENFSKKLKDQNDLINWEDKLGEDLKAFNTRIEATKSYELELLAEGYRCLSQIYINLIKDFGIFRAYPIRKYSSAYTYISNVNNFEILLEKIGYKENEENMNFVLNNDLKELENPEYAMNTAFTLLLCFMELSEIIKLRYHLSESKDLCLMRKNKIDENLEKDKIRKMSEDEIWDRFKKCELCSCLMDKATGKCSICGNSVADFLIAPQFKGYIKKQFGLEVTEPVVNEDSVIEKGKKSNLAIAEDDPKLASKTEAGSTEETNGNNWICNSCTYINTNENINCGICENMKPRH